MRGHLVTAAQLRRATVEAERAGAAKAELVASMSHELRTPLNAVIGYSQMLLEEAADEKDQASMADLEKIHRAGQHLLRLVNEVLDLSKIEAGKMELSLETVRVGDLLQSTADCHREAADAKGFPLNLAFDGDLGDALWDSQRVRQALDQILTNAVKFTQAGHVTMTARRQAAQPCDLIVVEVRDTGAGISPDMLPRLFEKFTVAHDASASKYGDAGLGLALSQALCRLMDGDISAKSVLGQGSCFTVTLPTVQRADGADDAEAAAEAAELTVA